MTAVPHGPTAPLGDDQGGSGTTGAPGAGIAAERADLAAIKAMRVACATCEGGGMEWSGAEYAGIREYVGCQDCMGSGVDVPALLAEVERLTAENARLRADAELAGIARQQQMMPGATVNGVPDPRRAALTPDAAT